MRRLILLGLLLAVNLLASAQLSEVSERIKKEQPEFFELVENSIYAKWVQRPTVVFDLNRQLGAYDRVPKTDTARLIPVLLKNSLEGQYTWNHFVLLEMRAKGDKFHMIKVDWVKVEKDY